MQPMIEASCQVLDQLSLLIQDVSISIYSEATTISTYGVGRHVRHILDHYVALQKGIDSGCVDYNFRQRESVLEHQPSMALEMVEAIKQWVNQPQLSQKLRSPILIESEISVTKSQSVVLESCVERELWYCLNHCIHHMAYAALLAKANGEVVDKTIGIAPATASFLRETRYTTETDRA